MKPTLIRITTVPLSLKILLKGQHRFMSQFYKVLGVSSRGSDLQEVATKEGIAVAEVEMTRTIAPLKDLVSLWNFYKLCKKEQPFIVHSHTPKAGIVGMLGAKLAGVPHRLHTVAGMPLLEATGFKRTLLNIVEKLTYSCATKVYPNSKGLEKIIKAEKFAKTEKLKVLANGSSNGIDTSYFNNERFTSSQNEALKQQLGIEKNAIVFIFVGRLVGDKGINELVAAFKELSVDSSQFSVGSQQATTNSQHSKLLLVGPLETELDPLLAETQQEILNNKHIISVGWQEDVRPYFAISNVLVFPSYREGFPNVVLQAGAMALPSIVTNINGCNEIIEEGKNGWIIPVKDKDAILKAMQHCLVNEASFNIIKSNARKMVETRYEQLVVWNALLEEYEGLV
ncbi:glycosyltransferase family 4 protein [Lutibacter sp. A64]|uniref:glycosyltransferase family 4 protein n=1 Tax=Lutibacter sp. A64 TaxID=2918526 RepID=UPI001F056D37|nr:glycosyltransferase family 4 protein [Lutibacter sp. A64]UMB55458.1 glycosyltransferase family 4 protein [Lutibacter sp. A64]